MTKYILSKYSKDKKRVVKDLKERNALITQYIEEDRLENPDRPQRCEFQEGKEGQINWKQEKRNYNMRKMLGDEGIIPYLVKRAITFPYEYGKTISAYLDLKKKVFAPSQELRTSNG